MNPLWILPCVSVGLAAQVPVELHAPIRQVRLHPDEAWVTRVGQARLAAAGNQRLVIKDLPAGLTIEDLRVAAKGPQGTRLGDLSVASQARKVTETPEYQALKREWEGVRDHQDALEAEGEALAHEQSFLRGLQAAYDKDISARLSATLPAPGSVVELSKGLEGRMADLLTRDRRRRRELEQVREQVQRLDNELRQRSAQRSASPSQVTVELAVSRPGEVEVSLSYRTRRARWEPGYEARLSGDGRKVELVLFATVRQASGEDWTGVDLEVTNSRSSRSLILARYDGPQIVSHRDQELEAGAPRRSRKVMALPSPAQDLAAAQNLMVAPEAEAPVEAAPAEAAPVEEARGLAATWALAGAKEVPADNEPHRFRVLSREIDPELDLVAVPRLDPTVYRVARFQAPAGMPIFPGASVVHYAGTQRVGLAPLELPAPGKPLQFGFGPYRGARVSLQRLEARKEQVGAFTKESQWTLKERFSVANDTGEALAVELQDRELKSASDQVRITPTPDSTPSQEGPLPGVRAWRIKLAPKGEAAVLVGTVIRAPANGQIIGLGDLRLPD